MQDWVIGVDLGGTKIELGLVSPANQIVARHRIPTLPQQGPQRVVERIVESVHELEQSLPGDARVRALGICSPGPVDHETGTLMDPPNLAGLHNAPLRQLLEEQLKIPVSLEHDAKAAALGEYHYGVGRGEQSMVYIVIGTGVGGAIINNGELLRGLHNSAGEIGHITLDPNGEKCSCGRYGCVETYMSGPWLAKHYQHLADDEAEEVTAIDVAQRAIEGDPLAKVVVHRAGQALGRAIAMTAMMLNVDLFVIGGSVAKSRDLIIEPARRALADYAYRSVECGVKIVASDLDTDGPILGCAWLARQATRLSAQMSARPKPRSMSSIVREQLEQVEGVVFDVQRFSIHDGPGIRTNVFLKGCPLRCDWCANPESQSPQPQLALSAQQCITCGQFEDACKDHWGNIVQTQAIIDKFAPRTDLCPTHAIRWIGERRTAGDVMREVKRDATFYGEAGGLTITGGEPTFQPRMVEALARLAKADGLSVAIETAGHTRWKVFERLLPYLDLILFDLKHMDAAKHKAHTGIDNELILSNLCKLAENHAPVQVRVPLIPDFNANKADIIAIAEYVAALPLPEPSIGLLPYHTLGRAKYRALAREYPWADHQPLTDDDLNGYASIFESYGISVSIGG